MNLFASLDELQRIKRWLVAHHEQHPMEMAVFDSVLALWVMGWVGMLPAVVFGQVLALPLCWALTCVPQLYIGWRVAAHQRQRLRCDWAVVRQSSAR